MLRPIGVLLFAFLFSVQANALVISQYDAFGKGDNLAMRDGSSGLVWLDFGVNNGQSFNMVINNLGNIYNEWRLPTEAEVDALWGCLSGIIKDGGGLDVFGIWGSNVGASVNLPYVSSGYFLDKEGYLSNAYLIEDKQVVSNGVSKKVIDAKYGEVPHFLYELGAVSEQSVLLVRKTLVSEGGNGAYLLLLLLFVFVVSRKFSRA